MSICSILSLGYNRLHVLVFVLTATFHSLCTTAKKGFSAYWPCLRARCTGGCTLYISTLPGYACSLCMVLCVPLPESVFCLFAICCPLCTLGWILPFCVLCCIAWMCLWPACCGCMLSVLFTIGGIPMHCVDVFVAYVLCLMVSVPLSEGLCGVLCLVWAGYMCILCFLYLPQMC